MVSETKPRNWITHLYLNSFLIMNHTPNGTLIPYLYCFIFLNFPPVFYNLWLLCRKLSKWETGSRWHCTNGYLRGPDLCYLQSHSLVHSENNSYFVGIGPICDIDLICVFHLLLLFVCWIEDRSKYYKINFKYTSVFNFFMMIFNYDFCRVLVQNLE